jgi:hypothetical protein
MNLFNRWLKPTAIQNPYLKNILELLAEANGNSKPLFEKYLRIVG